MGRHLTESEHAIAQRIMWDDRALFAVPEWLEWRERLSRQLDNALVEEEIPFVSAVQAQHWHYRQLRFQHDSAAVNNARDFVFDGRARDTDGEFVYAEMIVSGGLLDCLTFAAAKDKTLDLLPDAEKFVRVGFDENAPDKFIAVDT